MRGSSRRRCGRPHRVAGSPRSPSGTSGLRSRWRRPVPISTTRSSRWTVHRARTRADAELAGRGVGRAWPAVSWTPLAAEVYPLTEAKTAFRRMQQARHIGKIVLQMPKPLQPRGDRSYLITGGLGALGLHTAAHLAQLGAGDIVLTSRRAPDADAQRAIAEITERYRCRIHVFAADVGDEAQVERAAGADPGGVAAAGGRGTPGGRARRRAATTAEPGTFPDDVGAQGLRRLPPTSVDEERRS